MTEVHQGAAARLKVGKSDPLLLVAELCECLFCVALASVAHIVVGQRAEAEAGRFAALKASDPLEAIAVEVVLPFAHKSLHTERRMLIGEVLTVVQFTAMLLDLCSSRSGKQSSN